MKRNKWILSLSLFLFFSIIATPLSAEEDKELSQNAKDAEIQKQKQHLKEIRELEKLISVAKEAGFTEKEVQEITIQRHGKTINVWNFLQEEYQRQKTQASQEQSKKQKNYLTTQDITEELEQKEPNQLKQLRDKTFFSGVEQE